MTQYEHFEPGLAELADSAGLTDRETTDATAAHEQIAAELWAALHRLGVNGRMLVLGEDAEVYADLPQTERRISPGTTAELIGRVPSASWPHSGLQLDQLPSTQPDPFDLVINNIPGNDLEAHSTVVSVRHWHQHAINALGSMALTSPGGLTVLLASSRLLDDTEPYVRRELSRATELVGALRLPAGALRQGPDNDGTVDLILLHHRGGLGPTPFTESIPVTLDGRTVHVNEYYDTHPDHILGALTSRDSPWGPAATTVVPDHADLATELRTVLTRITDAAQTRGLAPRSSTAALAAPTESTTYEPGTQRPSSSVAVPVQELTAVRAAVARLRAQRRNTDQTTLDQPTPRAPGVAPEPPGL